MAGVDGPLPPEEPLSRDYPPVRPGAPVALIVGFGPAGMFAALRCLEPVSYTHLVQTEVVE